LERKCNDERSRSSVSETGGNAAVILGNPTHRRITRRARKSRLEGGVDILRAEACARHWFLGMGVPCWSDPFPPGEAGRYGLLFQGARRALVLPEEGPAAELSFDGIMKAKCDYLVSVRLDGEREGIPTGFLYWFDLDAEEGIDRNIRTSTLLLRRMTDFPELMNAPQCFRRAFLYGSLMLLLRGEPAVPAILTRDYVQTTMKPMTQDYSKGHSG